MVIKVGKERRKGVGGVEGEGRKRGSVRQANREAVDVGEITLTLQAGCKGKIAGTVRVGGRGARRERVECKP